MGGNPGMLGRQRMSMGGGGTTPPLPALSPGPTPDSSPDHTKTSNKANHKSNINNGSSRPDLLGPTVPGKQIPGVRDRHHNHPQPGGKAGRKLPLDEATAVAASMNGLTVDLESVLGLQGRNYGYRWTISGISAILERKKSNAVSTSEYRMSQKDKIPS